MNKAVKRNVFMSYLIQLQSTDRWFFANSNSKRSVDILHAINPYPDNVENIASF